MERKKKNSKPRYRKKAKNVAPPFVAPAGNPAEVAPELPPPSLITTTTKPFLVANVVQGATVLTILANQLSGLTPADQFQLRTVVSDNAYHAVSLDFVRTAIVTDQVLSPASYHADVFDCDDYVQYLKTKMSIYAAVNKLACPLAVGYVLTVLHAFTICITEQGNLVLINTQSPTGGAPFETNPALFQLFLQATPQNPITSIYI